jgi:hypothetical protein
VGTQTHPRFNKNELSVTVRAKKLLIESSSNNAYPTKQKHNLRTVP